MNYLKTYKPFDGKIFKILKNDNYKSINNKIKKAYNYKLNWNNKKKINFFKILLNNLKKEKRTFLQSIISEVGVSYKDANYEFIRAVRCIESAKRLTLKINNHYHDKFIIKKSKDPKIKIFETPFRLIYAVTPFNLPLVLSLHKILPAILSGSSMIIKPSEKTPNTCLLLERILKKSGLPKNFLFSIIGSNPKKITKIIMKSKLFDCYTFTGSSNVGEYFKKELVKNGHYLKKFIPELGGCSSLIVCSDADINQAVKIIIDGCFGYSGQRCTSIRRVIVENKIRKQLINNLIEKSKKINFGDPKYKNNDIGSLINRSSLRLVTSRINSSIKHGAELKYGNKTKKNSLSPTILDKVNLGMEIVSKETFGPICAIIRSKNLDHSIKLAKSTEYRMACGIVTRNKKKAIKAFKELRVGQFSFNNQPGYRNETAPFGGFNSSGNGEKEGLYLASKSFKEISVFYEHKN